MSMLVPQQKEGEMMSWSNHACDGCGGVPYPWAIVAQPFLLCKECGDAFLKHPSFHSLETTLEDVAQFIRDKTEKDRPDYVKKMLEIHNEDCKCGCQPCGKEGCGCG